MCVIEVAGHMIIHKKAFKDVTDNLADDFQVQYSPIHEWVD